MTDRMIGYWNTESLPADIEPIHASWHEHGPSDIRLFSGASALDFVGRTYGEREVRALKACRLPAMQSDLFRVLAIHALGGFYCDVGIRLHAYPSPFLPVRDGALTLYRRWHGGINNGMFSAEAGNPILARLIATMLDNIERRASNSVMAVTGPFVWREATDNGNGEGVVVHEHRAIVGPIFEYDNTLMHRSGPDHWSKRQNEVTIFNDPAGDAPTGASDATPQGAEPE